MNKIVVTLIMLLAVSSSLDQFKKKFYDRIDIVKAKHEIVLFEKKVTQLDERTIIIYPKAVWILAEKDSQNKNMMTLVKMWADCNKGISPVIVFASFGGEITHKMAYFSKDLIIIPPRRHKI
jgi:hypothetical protein